jgi:hypothetical protein
MEKTGMTGEEYEEYQQIQFHNERKVDATINRITNTLERINIKLDKLTDTMVNVKK